MTGVCVSVFKKQRFGFEFSIQKKHTHKVLFIACLEANISKGVPGEMIIATRLRNCGTFGLMEKVAKIQEARVDECLPKIKEVAGKITLPC